MKTTTNTTLATAVNAVPVLSRENFDGITCVLVSCPTQETLSKLPTAIRYEGLVLGRTGWNSDSCVAYYRSDAALAFAAN